jgi:hypothetical protein
MRFAILERALGALLRSPAIPDLTESFARVLVPEIATLSNDATSDDCLLKGKL